MGRTTDKPWLVPEFLSEAEVAVTLGRSRAWLRQARPAMEREGFPRVDGLIGLTCRQDVQAWIGRRRRVSDLTEAEVRDSAKAESQDMAGVDLSKL